MPRITRREFLVSTAAVTASSVFDHPSIAQTTSRVAGINSQRILSGWEHHRSDVGGTWEVWRGSHAADDIAWQVVQMPHCFNAHDAVDPDQPYYQGPAWYRIRLPLPIHS